MYAIFNTDKPTFMYEGVYYFFWIIKINYQCEEYDCNRICDSFSVY